jgi:hypothetical protein
VQGQKQLEGQRPDGNPILFRFRHHDCRLIVR